MKKIEFAAVFIMVLLLASIVPFASAARGPRRDLDIIWYENPDAAYAAMKAGEIHTIQWSLTKEQLEDAEADPNLVVSQYVENGMMEFDINNNKTIMDYPTSTNPMSIQEVRQAIAHLVDVDYIVANILEYFGSRIDAPVCYPQTEGWVNESVVTFDWNHNGIIEPSEDNYPYKYDPNAAADLLAKLGFSDTDANGYLNYPNDPEVWGDAAGIDTTAMPLKLCIRADHAHRREAGRYLYRQLEGDPAVHGDSILAAQPAWAENGKVGGDFDTTDETWVQPRPVLSPIVMRDRNYHIYTGGWSFGRFPTYLFFLFHSMFWYPYGSNYVSDHAHLDLDPLLEAIWYTPNIPSAQAAAKAYTGEHVIRVINRPLWSYTSYVGWRKELAGVVNMKGYGTVNDYTFLNAYVAKQPSATVKVGAVSSWDRLNILYSQWYFEYLLLDRVYTGLLAVNPYDLAKDMPWVARSWTSGTWTDPRDGLDKTYVEYNLRPDAGCAAPVDGNFTGFFNALDLEFTIWYNYAYDDSWQWSSFMDVHHTEIVDADTIRVYFDDISYWFQYAPTGPLLGPADLLADQLCEEKSATFTGADLEEVAPGYYEYQFTEDQVALVINATVNGEPIYEGVDYYIRAGYDVYCHNVFVGISTFADTDEITIWYYHPITGGAGGTYLGGNLGYDWTDTMFAYGTYYPVSITSASAALNRNPYFLLETPLLGEIDWTWDPSGYFKIFITDVVKCTASYCHYGTGTFDPVYMPGADIDETDLGHVGITDLVTITGKYAKTFGKVPLSVIGLVGGTTEATAEYEVKASTAYFYWVKRVSPAVRRSYHSIYTVGVSSITVVPYCYTPRDYLWAWCFGTGTCNIGASSITITPKMRCSIWWHKPDCTWENLRAFVN